MKQTSSDTEVSDSHFIIHSEEFRSVLGKHPRFYTVIETNAHEGPVYVKEEDALYFTTVPEANNIPVAGSKRVDITLATDMLLHAYRKHYDVAVLVAGDEDYVPLVRAVQGEGARVTVCFFRNGLSPALEMAADDFVDLEPFFFDAA